MRVFQTIVTRVARRPRKNNRDRTTTAAAWARAARIGFFFFFFIVTQRRKYNIVSRARRLDDRDGNNFCLRGRLDRDCNRYRVDARRTLHARQP